MPYTVQGKLESDHARPGKGSEKTLSLHLKLFLSTTMLYKIKPPPKINKNNRKGKKKQTMGEGENLISSVITLLDSNVQCSTKKSKEIEKNRKVWPIQKKKN